MEKKKILFVNQEVTPYVSKSELSSMGMDLPQAMHNSGFEIRSFSPKWSTINERRGQLHEVKRLSGLNIVIDGSDYPLLIKVASAPVSRMQIYFIDNDEFFTGRPSMTENEQGEEYTDNGERAIFYARGVIETVKKLRWTPDIIQCQGWMAGVVPFYIKTAYRNDPAFAKAKIVTSLFTTQFKQPFGSKFKTSVEYGDAKESLLESYSSDFSFIDLGKLAIDYSDAVAEGSPEVNAELSQWAKDKGLPVLSYPGEDYGEAYKNFYLELLGK